jgi:hypothetical protein
MKGHNMPKSTTIKHILESVGEYVGGFALFVIFCQTVEVDWQLMLTAMRDSMLLNFAPLSIRFMR